ncbi:MAG: LuxR C-terminal-related transcriptional regulator [Actinomycetes bacterium]
MAREEESVITDLTRLTIFENSFHPGMGFFISKGFSEDTNSSLETKVVDFANAIPHVAEFKPDVVIFDMDSMRKIDALNTALEIRKLFPDQFIIFMAESANPILVREGLISALWYRAFWLNEPTRNPSIVLSEILRAYNGLQQIHPSFLEATVSETAYYGRLSPQQHRVMRLMAMGGSNHEIASECKISEKAVERTISAASKLLDVEPSSPATNHRVNAANKYLRAVFYSDSMGL